MSTRGDEPWADILAELLQELDRGQVPHLDDYLRRYPGRDADVRQAFLIGDNYLAILDVLGRGPLRPGQCLGNFEIVDVLGRGGMGTVYRARQRSLDGRIVALKVLPAAQSTPDQLRRFQREAGHLADLPRHPCLAEVYDSGAEDGLWYYAMRLIEGRPLSAVLAGLQGNSGERDRLLAGGVIANWMLDVAGALNVVHRRGLLHRDVKPSNIVVEDGGRAVLLDFGLVKRLDSATLSDGRGCTPPYASREQVNGLDLTPSSDVFSFGATFHDLLLGDLRDESHPAHQGLCNLLHTVPGIDKDLAAIVRKATWDAPSQRYVDGEALLADLEAYLAGRPTKARRWSPRETASRWLDRHAAALARLLVIAAVLLAAVVSGGSLHVWLGNVNQTRLAHALGDLPVFMHCMEQIPPALRGAVLSRTMAADARALEVQDTWRAVADGGREAGVRFAMEAVLDPEASPLLVDFLEHELRSAREQGDVGLLNRLLREIAMSFAIAPAERVDLSPLRGVLREIADAPGQDLGLGRRTRLLGLSALIGCCTPEDLPWLLERFDAGAWPVEERTRLLWSMRAIVVRAQRAEQLGNIDFQRIVASVWPMLLVGQRRWVDHDSDAWWRFLDEASRVLRATAFAAEANQTPVPAPYCQVLDELWRGPWSHAEQVLLAVAAFRDPRLVGLLEGGFAFCSEGRADDRPDPAALGRLFGAYDDGVRGMALRQIVGYQDALRIDRCDGDDGAVDFAAVERAVLGAFRAVDDERRAQSESRAPRSTLPDPVISDRRSDAQGAQWTFLATPERARVNCLRSEPARLSGGVRQYNDDGEPCFALRPGDAEVQLPFTIEEGDPIGSFGLYLRCEPGARWQLPYGGEADYVAAIDGVTFAMGSLKVTLDDPTLPIPQRLLNPGHHELSLRCGEGSTTLLYVYEVCVAPP